MGRNVRLKELQTVPVPNSNELILPVLRQSPNFGTRLNSIGNDDLDYNTIDNSPLRGKNNFQDRKKSSDLTSLNYFTTPKKSGRNLLSVIDLKNMAKDREVKSTDVPNY